MPITTAIGEASPSAHGQAIINTETAYNNATSNGTENPKYHIKNVNNAIESTVGTNIDDILSASL
jgi:hypothetical protein